MTERENRRYTVRLRDARLRQQACLEDIDFTQKRGLDRALLMWLADCKWIKEAQNVFIICPTGVGKTYLACAPAHKACQHGHSALYFIIPRLQQELDIAKSGGRCGKILKSLAKADLLVIVVVK